MGYSHYWTKKDSISDDSWNKICALFRAILEKNPGIIQYESDTAKPPQIGSSVIRFNGIGELGCETFEFSRERVGFDFCKTSQKPYDIFVVSVLILVNRFEPMAYDIESDGSMEDWEAGRQLVSSVLGRETFLPLGVYETR